MDSNKLDLLANILMGLAVLLCLVTGVTRLSGMYYLMGFQSITLFIGGIAVMLVAIFLKLQGLSLRPPA